jgi:hypothetical protein
MKLPCANTFFRFGWYAAAHGGFIFIGLGMVINKPIYLPQ